MSEETTAPRFLNLAGLPAGFRLRDLILEERIGKGGFGVVYRARRGERLFAVKLPLLELGSANEDERRAARDMLPRVDREIASLKALKHPNVITVSEFFPWDPQTNEVGGDDGLPILVMPFIDGPQLDAWVVKARPTARTILRVLRDIAAALAEVHKRNFVHRDLKPANVLMAPDERPVLIDFGIAKGRSVQTVTGKQQMVGTVDYFAPEYVAYCTSREFLGTKGKPGRPFEHGPAQDVYALGHTFYRVLTGVSAWAAYKDLLPSQDVSIEFLEVLKSGVIPPPWEVNPAVPRPLGEMVLRMLERDLANRYERCQDIIVDAEAVTLAHPAPDPEFDTPFTLPSEEEGVQRAKDSSERIVASSLLDDGGADESLSLDVALSGVSGLSQTHVRVPSKVVPPPPPVPTANYRAPSVSRPTVPLSEAASKATPAPQVSQAVEPAAPSPLQLSAALQAEFRAPSAVVGAPASSGDDAERLQLDPSLERLRAQLAAANPRSSTSKTTAAILGLSALVLLLVVAIFALKPQPEGPKSLIEERESKTQAPLEVTAPAPLLALDASPSKDEVVGAVGPPAEAASPSPAPRPRSKGNADSRAVDEILAREYGGTRPVVGVRAEEKEVRRVRNEADELVSTSSADEPEAKRGPRRFGIAMGSEIPAKLVRPLDTRTPPLVVIAKLSRPFAPRGEVLLPSGTMVYGVGTGGNGRFEVQLNKLKLPDGSEVTFTGLGYDVSDKKPGLVPSRRVVVSQQASGPGPAEQVVKTTANAALGRVNGGDAVEVAKELGGAVLNGNGASTSGDRQDALLLDAPADFTIFITEAF